MPKIIFSLLFLLSSQLAFAFTYTKEFTEQELQQKVSAMTPIQYKKALLTLNFIEPQVHLLKVSDEVAISSPLELLVPGGIKGTGFVTVQGTISYDATKGEFHLKNPTISEIEIHGLPEKYLPLARETAQLAIGQALATRPVYTLKDDNLKQKLAKATIRSVTVKNEKLLVVLGVF